MDVSAPRRGELIWIAVFAVALRAAVFFAARSYGHLSMADYAALGDTKSYTAWAAVMTGDRPLVSLDAYDRRVFPGYPALIAIVHLTRVPLPWAAAIVTWICAGIAAGVSGRVFADARVGWAMTCLIPHYLINSTLGMSEAPVLAITALALLASQRDKTLTSGFLFGFAGLIRPVACFAVIGVVYALFREKRPRRGIIVALAALATVAVGLFVMKLWTGDAFTGPRTYATHPDAYAGHMIQWPLSALFTVPLNEPTSPWRIVYVWIHVAIVVIASLLLGLRLLRDKKPLPRDSVAWPWLTGNTIFAMCVGSPWGFRHFPRFTIPAAPALFWGLREWLPRRPVWWVLIAAALFWPAVLGIVNQL